MPPNLNRIDSQKHASFQVWIIKFSTVLIRSLPSTIKITYLTSSPNFNDQRVASARIADTMSAVGKSGEQTRN